MVKKSNKDFATDFRRFFLRGLATLLPTVLTIVVLVKCFEFVQKNISVHITDGSVHLIVMIMDDYPTWDEEDLTEFINKERPGLDSGKVEDRGLVKNNPKEINHFRKWILKDRWSHGPRALVGFGLAVILVYIVGRLLASFVGRRLWLLFENTVQQIPGFKQVYPYIKQVTEFLFGENKITFTRVVATPYPRQGIWSVGFVTGAGLKHVSESAGDDLLTVFIPSSPTPVTGYVIHVKKDEVIDLPITIEEALRFAVSGGVIVPEHQSLPTQLIELCPGPAVKNQVQKNDIKEN